MYKVGNDPTGTLNFTNSAVTAAVNLANAYIALNGASSPSGFSAYNMWPSNQKVVFHQTLINGGCNNATMTKIDADL